MAEKCSETTFVHLVIAAFPTYVFALNRVH